MTTWTRYGNGVGPVSDQPIKEAIALDNGQIVDVLSTAGAAKKTQVFASAAAEKNFYDNAVYTNGRLALP